MPLYNLIEYSGNHSKTLSSLWQYYRAEQALDHTSAITNLGGSSFFGLKKMAGKTSADGNTKIPELAVPFKYLSNFWRILEIPLINCKINVILTWSATCLKGEGTFGLTDTKRYVPAVTLSTHVNAELLQQFKSDFKRTINWNKNQSKSIIKRQNQYFDYLINPSFQRVNRLFDLSFEDGPGNGHTTVSLLNYVYFIKLL